MGHIPAAPGSPAPDPGMGLHVQNGGLCLVEAQQEKPHMVLWAGLLDDRLFSMLPYKSLCFTGMKDRHGLYAVIGKDENRDKEVRRPRASIRRQLSETKQAQALKKAPARTKKNELEV